MVKRLGRVVGAAGSQTFVAVAFHCVGGQRDDWQAAATPAQFGRGGVAVHHRHLHVHHDQVDSGIRFGLDKFDRFLSVRRDLDRTAGLFDKMLGEVTDIIDNQPVPKPSASVWPV